MEKFEQRKLDVLNKQDKSSIGSWDEKILKLCEVLNGSENYYTTSSCSGRILFVKDVDEKAEGNILVSWHDKIDLGELMRGVSSLEEKSVKFKQEPPILHVACKDLDSAQSIVDLARSVGFRRSGIQATKKNFVVELCATEKLEFPLVVNGELVVDEKFLKIALEKANKNMEKGWEKIEKLRKLVE